VCATYFTEEKGPSSSRDRPEARGQIGDSINFFIDDHGIVIEKAAKNSPKTGDQ